MLRFILNNLFLFVNRNDLVSLFFLLFFSMCLFINSFTFLFHPIFHKFKYILRLLFQEIHQHWFQIDVHMWFKIPSNVFLLFHIIISFKILYIDISEIQKLCKFKSYIFNNNITHVKIIDYTFNNLIFVDHILFDIKSKWK